MEQINKRLLNWASILEEGTREQAITSSSMPFIHPHLALMPDAHLGKGATVGSVIPTVGAIMPAAVGVDIGCGMDAVLTQFTVSDLRERGPLAPLREAIEEAVPLSPGVYNTEISETAEQYIEELDEDRRVKAIPLNQYAPNWQYQLGSLGGGNHFIEVTADERDRVWLFLHSGSRGVGNKIAQHHIKKAVEWCERAYISLPHRDLAYLVEGTPEFTLYISELRWAQRFAAFNRAEMMERTIGALEGFMDTSVDIHEQISCHHNYTTRERHMGKDVWLSRKGAIDAHEGVRGLIPGSMGTASYVVTGKGNKAALCSAPHGAGRVYSRSAARKEFTLENLRDSMRGIEYRESEDFIDEIPMAYKDIDQVMIDAADLVSIDHTLTQLVNVKGQ